jgi:hypothetical protein
VDDLARETQFVNDHPFELLTVHDELIGATSSKVIDDLWDSARFPIASVMRWIVYRDHKRVLPQQQQCWVEPQVSLL